jgi:YD repeat-containing protein
MTKSALTCLTLIFFLISGCDVGYNPEDLFPNTGQRKLVEILKDGNSWQKFRYDDGDNLIKTVVYYSDEDSISFTYSYDERDRLLTRQMPYQKDTLIYDQSGRLITMITSWPGSPRSETTQYTWSKGRISMGRVFVDGNLVDKIDFLYDAKGNTRSRKSLITEYTFEYDNKLRPMKDMAHYPIDIIQKNNPVKTYYSNLLMSSFPPNYEHQYEYSEDGYPVRETRTDIRTKQTTLLEYLYSE